MIARGVGATNGCQLQGSYKKVASFVVALKRLSKVGNYKKVAKGWELQKGCQSWGSYTKKYCSGSDKCGKT